MKRNLFSLLIEKQLPPRAFVENSLRVLEHRLREVALIGLADWQRAEIPAAVWLDQVPELITAVGKLQRPSWGHWSGLLRQLAGARKRLRKQSSPTVAAKLDGSTYLKAVLDWLDTRTPSSLGQRLNPLATLLGTSCGKRLTWHTALELPITLRNQIAHYSPSDPAWWAKAADGLRPLIEELAADQKARPIPEPVPLPSPWFIPGGSSILAFGGMTDDFTPVYVGLNVAPSRTPQLAQAVMVAFRQLLGAADTDEVNFRRLMNRIMPEEQKGVQLGEYLVGKPVGEGGFARVHVGWQMSTGRKAAIKILHDGLPREYRLRFQDEAGFLGQLDHPGIVGVFGHGVATWTPREYADLTKEEWFQDFKRTTVKEYIALEFVEGRSLEQVLKQTTVAPPTLPSLIAWFAQAAEALAEVHRLDLIHRDLKPSNVIVTPGGRVKLLDFGIARLQAEAQTIYTHLGKEAATPVYAAPEQLRKDQADRVGSCSDIYSLCATFYELFCNARLYDYDQLGVEQATSRKLAGDSPIPPRWKNPRVPWEVEVLLLGGLQNDIDLRPKSARELAEDLRRIQENQPIKYRRPSLARRISLWGRRNKRPLRVAATSALVAIIASTGIAYRLVSVERGKNSGLQSAAAKSKESERAALRKRRLGEYEREMTAALNLWELNKVGELRALLDRYDPSKAPVEEDMRGIEWYYLNRLISTEVRTWKARGYAARFSPDGNRLAVLEFPDPSEGHRIMLLDISTGKIERFLGLGKTANLGLAVSNLHPLNYDLGGNQSVAFSRNGKRIAATCVLVPEGRKPTGVVKVWETETGREVFSASDEALDGLAVTFSPNGEYVLAGGYNFAVLVWHLPSGRLAWTLPSYHPGIGGGEFRLEAPRPDLTYHLPASIEPVTSLSFGKYDRPMDQRPIPATHFLVRSSNLVNLGQSSQRKTSICQWPPDDNKPASIASMSQQRVPVFDDNVAVSSDGRWSVLTNRVHSDVYLRDLKSLNPVDQVRRRTSDAPDLSAAIPVNFNVGKIQALAIEPGAVAAAGMGGRVVVAWIDQNNAVVTGRRTLRGHAGSTYGLVFNPERAQLAALGDETVVIWDLNAPAEVKTILDLAPVPQRDRGVFTSSTNDRWKYRFGAGIKGDSHPWIEVVDTTRPDAAPRRVRLPVKQPAARALSADGSLFAVSSYVSLGMDEKLRDIEGEVVDVPIHLVSTLPGGEARTLNGPKNFALSLMFDCKSKRLLSAIAGEQIVRLWDVKKGVEERRYDLKGKVVRAEFSPDGRWIVGGDVSGAITIWSVDQPRAVRMFRTDRIGVGIPWALFGNMLAFAEEGKRINIWNLDKDESVGEVLHNGRRVDDLAFLSGGSRLITLEDNSSKLTLWSVDTGREILFFPNQFGNVSLSEIAAGLTRLQTENAGRTR